MSAGPQVTITSPGNEATIPTGQTVEIQSVASDNVTPIRRIEMYINGDLIADDSTPDPEGQASFTVVQRWVPVEPGEAQVEVYAYNLDDERSEAATITLQVEGEPLAPPQETTATATQSLAAATAEPTEVPATPTLEPAAGIEGRVAAEIGLNVREGPGADSRRIGGVNLNETVTAIARNEAGDWIKIRYGPDNSEGWVAGEYVEWQGDTQTLPVE
ncbi:MAG: SH3 domain-containing protein [Chloroflexota bacterium]|nr:SH3 domain-containing protein [Chloroflexota bacterium]